MTAVRYFSADLLRAISAQAVVVSHAALLFLLWSPTTDYPVLQKSVVWLSSFGHHAVIVFFVLSGFLVGGKTIERISIGEFSLPRYAIDRLFRLWIVAVPAVALGGALDLISFNFGHGADVVRVLTPSFMPIEWNPEDSLSVATAVCNALFMQTIACPQIGSNLALWSITNEAIYYATFPTLMFLFTNRATGNKMVTAVAVLLAIGFLVMLGKTWSLLFGFAMWVAGALTYTLLHHLSKTAVTRVSGALIAVVGVVMCSRNGYNAWSDLGASIAACGMLIACQDWRPDWRPVRQTVELCSAYSYSLYATHLPVMFALLSFIPNAAHAAYGPSTVALCAFAVIASNAVALAFYSAFERHDAQFRKAVHLAAASFRRDEVATTGRQ